MGCESIYGYAKYMLIGFVYIYVEYQHVLVPQISLCCTIVISFNDDIVDKSTLLLVMPFIYTLNTQTNREDPLLYLWAGVNILC